MVKDKYDLADDKGAFDHKKTYIPSEFQREYDLLTLIFRFI